MEEVKIFLSAVASWRIVWENEMESSLKDAECTDFSSLLSQEYFWRVSRSSENWFYFYLRTTSNDIFKRDRMIKFGICNLWFVWKNILYYMFHQKSIGMWKDTYRKLQILRVRSQSHIEIIREKAYLKYEN